MTISSIPSYTPGNGVSQVNGTENITQQQEWEFLEILLEQMANQDPMEPMDSKDMLTQLSQLTMVQEMSKLTSMFTELSEANELSYAASLIGKKVVAGDGSDIEGVVESVDIIDGNVSLSLGVESIPLSSVVRIMENVEDD